MAAFSVSTFIDKVAVALDAAVSLNGVTIYDGPIIGKRYTAEAVLVGHDGNFDDEVSAANATIEYLTQGSQIQREDGAIECAIFSFAGSSTSTMKALRDRADVILAAVNTVILSDSTFTTSVKTSGITNYRLAYIYVENRIGVKINFSIFYIGLT